MTRLTKGKVLLLSVVFVLYSPIHEFGHWFVAHFDGAEILDLHLFPYWENGLASPCTVVNVSSFSSLNVLILFKLAGFLITFVPPALLYFFLRKTDWWITPAIWVMASPAVSCYDFWDIGGALGNPVLGIGSYLTSFAVTIGLFIWFRRSYLRKSVTR